MALRASPVNDSKGKNIKIAIAAIALLAGGYMLVRYVMTPSAGSSTNGPVSPPADYKDTSKPRGGPALAPGQDK